MKKVAMIPARLGSKRVPKKNLRLILGRPLISYVIESAVKSGVFDEIYVNSEAGIFGDIAEEYGVSFYQRDPQFSSDKSVNDEFLLDFLKHVPCDSCIQILPTSPLLDALTIQRFVQSMTDGDYDTLVSVARHQIAALYADKPLNFTTTEAHRSSQEMEPVYTYATVLMGWKTDNYLKSIEEIGSGYHGGRGKTGYFEVGGLATIDIDEEKDFLLAEVALKAQFATSVSEPQYYEGSQKLVAEVDVPSILKRDGVMASDFSEENRQVTNLDELIASKDSSRSWCHRVINTDSNSATVISQLPGEGNRLHFHPDWNEWWYILRGEWVWTIDGVDRTIKPGDLVLMPKGIWHKITAAGNGPAVRLAVSRADVAHVYNAEDSQGE